MESDGSLRVWKGDYGAPSLDSISLQALSYVKFTGAKVRITYGSLPQWAPIPSYRDKLGLCESSSEILQRIKATVKCHKVHLLLLIYNVYFSYPKKEM